MWQPTFYLALMLVGSMALADQVSAQAPPKASPKGVAVAPAVDAVREKVVAALNAGDGKALFELLNDGMRKVLPAEAAQKFVAGIRDARGKITGARATKAGDRNAVYLLAAEKGQWSLSLDLDGDGLIAGLLITDPPAPSPPVATNKIAIDLPFKGRWLVFWGGDTLKLNQHVEFQSQRRAADLLGVGPDGKTHRGDGKSNEDYFAFGRDILAASDGRVITAIDGVPDNPPGVMNPYFALGNAVIIEHEPKLFSAYCHLQRGSVKVELGQAVKKGDLLGLCGNSGNTSEPHLHFQLHDGPRFESAWGIEAVFDNVSVTRGGSAQIIPKYRFLKGDIIDAAK